MYRDTSFQDMSQFQDILQEISWFQDILPCTIEWESVLFEEILT